MVKAGLANFLINFNAKSTPDEVVGEPRVGDCDEVDVIYACQRFLFKNLLDKIKIFCIGGSSMQVNFLTFPR